MQGALSSIQDADTYAYFVGKHKGGGAIDAVVAFPAAATAVQAKTTLAYLAARQYWHSSNVCDDGFQIVGFENSSPGPQK